MAIQIDEAGTHQPAPQDAIALLLACHARIRRYCATAARIADALEPDHASVEATRRYFTEALPLHAEDEDTLFLPRVRAHHPIPPAISEQHAQIQALLPQMAERWTQLLTGERAHDLAAITARWTTLLEAHLALEEATFIPQAQALLTPAEHQRFVADMLARRNT